MSYEEPTKTEVARMILYSRAVNGRPIIHPHWYDKAKEYELISASGELDEGATRKAADGHAVGDGGVAELRRG